MFGVEKHRGCDSCSSSMTPMEFSKICRPLLAGLAE
eukprot:CAMPEP_0181486104 /NCGR_PEP_ID=MMETSP1110-20121109/46934_1 /TAXON_ID=174948 /ORGANISM="Symbiodinium sp., Strain CCMP421" /LENGTH=35 /DNA_ID= /DNA_START= /DNA_END= /DNA_ORIENTATION=